MAAPEVAAGQVTVPATEVAALLASRLQGQPISFVGTLMKVSNGPNRHQLTDTDNNPNSPTADPRADLQLLPSLRYAHSPAYVERLAGAHGFRVQRSWQACSTQPRWSG